MPDAEWHLIETLLPVPACQTPAGGHPEAHPRREIVDGIRSTYGIPFAQRVFHQVLVEGPHGHHTLLDGRVRQSRLRMQRLR